LHNRDATDRNSGITQPAATQEKVSTPEPNPTLGEWLQRNLSALILLGLVLIGVYYWFGAENLWNVFKVAIGLGLVIFIHELGHFAVAKWCDVHVETFSIGFGPALPGCKFKRGETTYMIGLVPLGGYVKMVGEGPESEEADEDPRSFKNKSVWQRMAIISAGVIMNVILAFICFIIVFRGPGKEQPAGVVGHVVPASPAWKKGIPSGALIHKIGSKEETSRNPLFFTDLMPEVMLSGEGEELPFVYSNPPFEKQKIAITLQARKEKDDDRPLIGVLGDDSLKLVEKRFWPGREHPVYLHSAAARAKPPFDFEDLIIGSTDPSEPKKEWTPLPPDARNTQKKDQPDFFVFARRLQDLAGQEMTIRVRRKDGKEVNLSVPGAFHYTFGMKMQMGPIAAVRDNSAKDRWEGDNKPVEAGPSGKGEGDIIEQVEVKGEKGKIVYLFPSREQVHPKRKGKILDPARLRFELQQWAAKAKGDKVVTFHVRRPNKDTGNDWKPFTLKKRWDDNPKWKYTQEVPLTRATPMSIPELGIAFFVKTTIAEVDKTQQPKLSVGDQIKKVRLYSQGKDGEEAGPWGELEANQWAHVFWAFQHFMDYPKIGVQINDSEDEIILHAQPDPTWPLADRGMIFSRDLRIQRADSIVEAVEMGLKDTYGKITQVYRTLRGFITNRISPKNLGGPITIARAAFTIAGVNFWEFVYFLGLISINLAVVNFLPIPVLDGGHMVFLIYEKIRGKPASEQVRSGATIVGLLLLASLMIFVLYLDISRIVAK
jgi:regulator of sigma E protease